MEKFYLGDTIETREGASNSGITRIRSGWCEFRYLVLLLASGGLSFKAKGRLYSTCVHMLYALCFKREIWPIKNEVVVRLKRNDARMA